MIPSSNKRAAQVTALLGFLTMGVVGWNIADDGQAAPSVKKEAPGIPTKPTKRPDRAYSRSGPPEAVRKRMAGIRAIGTPGDRMRATIELANTLPASEIAAWLDGRWFDTGQGFDLTLFNKILKERWAKEDPEGLVLWGLKNGPEQALGTISKWAETDPQRVLDFFKEHPNRDMELLTLTELAKKNPAIALQAIRDMKPDADNRNGMNDYYFRGLMQQLAANSPAALESAIESLPTSMKLTAEAALSGERLKASFADEVEKLWDRPDGWKIFERALNHSNDLGDSIFAHLADLPPGWRASMASNSYSMISDSAPEKWCTVDLEGMGFSESEASNLRAMAFTKYGYKNPEAALKLMADAGMNENARGMMIGNVFRNYRGDPEKVDSLIALLGSEKDQQMARTALAANSATRNQQSVTPSEWLDQVSTAESGAYQFMWSLGQWDKEKLNELGKEFRSMPDDKKLQVAKLLGQNSGVSENAMELQGDALHYLIANPVEPKQGESQSNTVGPASEFAVKMSKTDPFAAADWVRRLPTGEARQWAQKNLAANWAQYDPEATEQWINSLPADERPAVRDYVKKKAGMRQ